MNRTNLKKVVAEIRKHKRFLITAHTSPEGDALGAELAFLNLVKKLGKSGVIINEDVVPKEYNFLPEKENIGIYKQNIRGIEFDCMVIVDCSDLSRTGEVYKLNKWGRSVINIDHHVSNDKFGNVNWVDPLASSASEMVFKLYKEMCVSFDKVSALQLYVGIMTDTGSFRYTNTTSFTHKAAGELMKFNFDVRLVYKMIYESIPFHELKLLSKILLDIKRSMDDKVIWIEIPRHILRHERLSFDLSEQVLSFMRMAKDAQVVALFKENFGVKDEIRFNLRSHGVVDVNKIAQYFGGGGHKTASGCTMCGKLSSVRKKVLAKIRENLK
ncbi:MAG: bifunctional oligoribonuclease/PAP phosphatase NrnA [Candidatus Omnitrophica bacterium]|nr:bifunctional oligoribonuclease/PAP phosphatase NrnA [Candidatus Omnitrophota bacterium]